MKSKDRIPFNRPTVTGLEAASLKSVVQSGKFCGGGPHSKLCNKWLKDYFRCAAALTTSSCTDALEMAALLCDIEAGDEVILPSYTFTSTATAFARCGASLVFVDVDPLTMNIDPARVAEAITVKTKIIVVVHYAGIPCEMDALCKLAADHNIDLIEDAAQAIFSKYKGKLCGTFGRFGCISFHETKNIHCGEGGVLICNQERDIARAEIILEKGTDRLQYFRGEVDKYTWRDIGSSFVLSELQTAFLFTQLQQGKAITENRLGSWNAYFNGLSRLAVSGLIEIPHVPDFCDHNGHMFWIKTESEDQRHQLIKHLDADAIHAVFHYQPLHSAIAGEKFGRLSGSDQITTNHSKRLLRLPLYFNFTDAQRVIDSIVNFYNA